MHEHLPADADFSALQAAVQQALVRGDHRAGAALARQAAQQAELLGDASAAGQLLAQQALHLARLGELVEAMATGQRALDGLTPLGALAPLSQVHSTLSMVCERAGLNVLAVSHASAALELACQAKDPVAEAWALNRLGTAATDDPSAPGRGAAWLGRAVALAQQHQHAVLETSALNNLSRLLVLQADRLPAGSAQQHVFLYQALPLAEAAAQVAARSAPGFGEATAAANLAGIQRRLGEPEKARAHFSQALALAEDQGFQGLAGTVRLAQAAMALEQAPSAQTRAALERQLDQADAGQDPTLRLQARRDLVQHCKGMGDLATALHHLERLHQEAQDSQAARVDLQTRLLIDRAELSQARLEAERARMDSELQRSRADAEARLALQVSQHRDRLQQEVMARTADLQRAKAAAEAANRAKSAFLSLVSHELRTPLHGVLGMVELARRAATDPRQAQQLAKAAQASRQLSTLIDHVLDYVAADASAPPVLVETELRTLLHGVLQSQQAQANAKGLSLLFELAPDLPSRFRLDGHRLGQILDMLLDNAVKFSQEGQVRVRASYGGKIQSARREGALLLRIEVTDTGPGLTPELVQRLFRPFEVGDGSSTRPHGGLGLGLALAQRLAQGLGGEVGVDSAPAASGTPDHLTGGTSDIAAGSTFWVVLPVLPSELDASGQALPVG